MFPTFSHFPALYSPIPQDLWKSNGYWSLRLDEDTSERILCHISGVKLKLPKAVGVDSVLLNAGDHHKASLQDDVVTVEVKSIVKHVINKEVAKHLKAPYWLESVPTPKLGGGSQTTPTKSDGATPSSPSTASPAKSIGADSTASPPPPPAVSVGRLACCQDQMIRW